MMQNRAYQTESINSIRKEFIAGHKRVMLHLATGGGKTHIFCTMVKESVMRGKRCIVVVRGRKLVDQASNRLLRENVPHGVLMNNHWNYRPNEKVQVCSIDTMISRNLKPEADLIIIDEAHLFDPSSKATAWLDQYDCFKVSVTATPYLDKGLRHLADAIVHPITMQGLIDLGYLVPFRPFAPASPDLSQVKVSATTKDYVADQLESVMTSGTLTGNIIEHWKKIAFNLPTIGFAVNIHHSKLLTQKFVEAGISAEHCDADTPDNERNEIIKRVESGETRVVWNVGILSVGVDVPCLRAIILARPTKSYNLYIQQAGRGTRPFEGKKDCILLDHAGNIPQHDLPTEEREASLDGILKETFKKKSKICSNCFSVYRGSNCPECGVVAPDAPTLSTPEENENELREVKSIHPILKDHKMFLREAKAKGHRPSWAHYKLIQKYGIELSRAYLSEAFVERYEKGRSSSSVFSRSPFRGAF